MIDRPNFLLIYTDQQRYDAVGANGNEAIRTPHTDRLAAEGANFANMFVASPNCMSSRAAFATGRYPHVNGVRWNGMALPRSETTFMQTLAEAGYETALYGKLHLWPHQSRSADDPTFGFGIANIAENLRTHAHSAYREWLAEHYPDYTDDARAVTYDDALQVYVPRLPAEAHFSTWAGDETVRYLESRPREPFFLTMSFVDPHHPFAPPEPYASMYDPRDVPQPAYTPGELDDKPPHFMDGHLGRVDQVIGRAAEREDSAGIPVTRVDLSAVSPASWRRLVAHYYGMVTLIDDQVGRALAALEHAGLADRTIVIFMSDHGELLGDHGLLFKGPHQYDALLRVPTIVRLPGPDARPVTIDGLVEQIDLTATILELAGLTPSRALQGTPVTAALRGAAPAGRESVLVERRDLYWDFDVRTLRTERWKLTHYAGHAFGELFDLQEDPGEIVNRWDDPGCRGVRADLTAALVERMAQAEAPVPERLDIA
jgi:arylsulfatase